MEKSSFTRSFTPATVRSAIPANAGFDHGHTWRGTIFCARTSFRAMTSTCRSISATWKNIIWKFDHKMIVTDGDKTFMDPSIFEPEGVVVIKGRGPSVENVAIHVLDGVVE